MTTREEATKDFLLDLGFSENEIKESCVPKLTDIRKVLEILISNKELRDALKEGMKIEQISKEFGIEVSGVKERLLIPSGLNILKRHYKTLKISDE